MSEIKDAHKYYITEFKHYLDAINQRDLLISISAWTCNVKIWNFNNFKCLYSLNDNGVIDDFPFKNDTFIYSACLIFENANIYFIFGMKNILEDENEHPIKVFDLKGNLIKDIKYSEEGADYITCYYDNITLKNYIISVNKTIYENYIKSYDFEDNKLFHKYYIEDNRSEEEKDNESDSSEEITIVKSGKITQILQLYYDCLILFWNFHSGQLVRKIDIINKINTNICNIILWNNKYLFLGCSDLTIKVFDIENEKISKELIGHKDRVKTLRKLIHPNYEECLFSQGIISGEIKLWITH